MMSSGLQRRLRWVLLVLLVSVAAVLWLGKTWVLEHELVKERAQLISQIDALMTAAVLPPLVTEDYALLQEVVNSLTTRQQGLKEVAVYDQRGQLVHEWKAPDLDHSRVEHVWLDLSINGVLLGKLEYDLSLEQVTRARMLMNAQLVLVLLLVLLSAVLVGAMVHRYLRQRLQAATRVAQAIARGEHQARLQIEAKDEFADLSVAVNDMASAIAEREQSLRYSAEHDALTGLPNRVALQVQMDRRVACNTPFLLVFLDLDGFKQLNDGLGHGFGDRVLVSMAGLLVQQVGEQGVVARFGGDEFVVLLDRHEGLREEAWLKQLVLQLTRPFTLDEHELVLGGSLGVVRYPEDARDGETLLRYADAAMYAAKAAGRNQYRFVDASLIARVEDRARLEAALRLAVEREELVLYFQPIVSAHNGQLMSFETLVRWQHPEWGMVSPARFIPVAEETGLIRALDAWVLRAACAQLADWRRERWPMLRLSVNVSADELAQPDYFQTVVAVLALNDLPAEALVLEMTESAVMTQPEQVTLTLQQLRTYGVVLAMDDFGTGYSSLSYLKQLPLHKVKIDQSFVRDVLSDDKDALFVQLVTDLAHRLSLTVVAEGVESAGQARALIASGCDKLQGFWLARPMPADQVEAWMVRWRELDWQTRLQEEEA